MERVKDPLEEQLDALRGPPMPFDVEERVRKRLSTEALQHPHAHARRFGRWGSVGHLLVLLALLLVVGWVLRRRVAPVVKAAWEGAHRVADTCAGQP